MSEEAQSTNDANTATTPAALTEPATPAAAETVEATTTPEAAPAEDDYSWFPKKYMKDGEPDFKTLAKSYTSLEQKLGKKGLIAPASPDEYEYQPSGYELDAERTEAFKSEALQAGLTKEQYQFIMSKYESVIGEIVMTPDRAETALKADWGNAYVENLQAARRAFDEFAPSDLAIDDPALNHPSVLKLLARLGAELNEDKTSAKTTASGPSGQSREEIDAIRASSDYYANAAKQAQVAQWYEKNYK